MPAWASPGLAPGPLRAFGAVRGAAARRRRWWWRVSLRVVFLVHAGLFAECLALVEDPQGSFSQRCFVPGGGAAPQGAFSEPLEHPHPLDAGTGLQDRADEPGDGNITRGVAQPAVLAGRADQALLFPVAQHPRGDPDPLGEPGDRQQPVIPAHLII